MANKEELNVLENIYFLQKLNESQRRYVLSLMMKGVYYINKKKMQYYKNHNFKLKDDRT